MSFGRKEPLRLRLPMRFLPARHDLHQLDITKSVAHSLRISVNSFDRDPRTDLGSRSHFGTAWELIVERSFSTSARGMNILGILLSRSGPTRRKSQTVAKSRVCQPGTNILRIPMKWGTNSGGSGAASEQAALVTGMISEAPHFSQDFCE